VLAATALALARSPLFRVREVRVEGVTHGSPARIVRLAGLSEHDRTLGLDLGALRARIERDPWVERAEIDIDLPSTITVRITERAPVATVNLGFGSVLVDAKGAIIAPGAGRGLPEIVLPPSRIERVRDATPREHGVSLEPIAEALAALPTEVRAGVVRAELSSGAGVELILEGGVRVTYGRAREVAAKAEVLTRILAWARDAGERVRAINVMAPSAPAVVLAP
jgi:cell division protein FtsQ